MAWVLVGTVYGLNTCSNKLYNKEKVNICTWFAVWYKKMNITSVDHALLTTFWKISVVDVIVITSKRLKKNIAIISADALIKQKGRDATLNWTIPFFPSSKLYSIFKHSGSDKNESEIIRLEDNKVTPINMEKYNYTSKPLNSTLIVFNVHSLTPSDAGVYSGGISSFDAARKRGVLLVVAGAYVLSIIFHNERFQLISP